MYNINIKAQHLDVEMKNHKYLRAKDAPGSWTTIDAGGLFPALILADVAFVPLIDVSA